MRAEAENQHIIIYTSVSNYRHLKKKKMHSPEKPIRWALAWSYQFWGHGWAMPEVGKGPDETQVNMQKSDGVEKTTGQWPITYLSSRGVASGQGEAGWW